MHETKIPPSTDEPLQCSLCSQSFKYPAALKKHSLTHVPKERVCRICNTIFDSESDVRTHKENVHTKLLCNICPATFPMNQEEKLLAHMDRMHHGKDRESAICSDCGSQFKSQNQLKIHNMTKCGTVKQFQCDQCESKFMTQNTLNAHKMIHLGEKKHLCNYCGKSFLSKGQLKVHERSHTLEKPFRCDVCDKAFSYRESLVTHSSLHTGIKPYLCEGCGSRFSCIGNLIKHRKSRPKTCGLPQFCKNTKIAPRASSKVPGSLTMKVSPKPPRKKRTKQTEVSSDEQENNQIKVPLESPSDPKNSVIRKNKPEQMEIEIEAPNIVDGQHFIIDDNITVESNIEIEFITSDELMPSEVEAEAIDYENSDRKYEENFVEIISSQQDDNNDDFDGGNESWDNDAYVKSDEDENQIIYVESELVEDKPVIRNMSIEEDNKNNIAIIDDVQVTDGYPETQTEIEDEQYNTSDEAIKSTELDELEEPEEFELYDVKYEDDEEPPTQELHQISQTLYQCELCPKMYILQGAYKTHLKTEHDIGIVKVPDVEKTTIKKAKTSKPEMTCKYCFKKYTSSNLLEKHVKVHGESGTLIYKCSCCSTWFSSTTECENHQSKLHKDKLFCEHCNKMFKEPDNLVAHNRYSHSDVPHSPKKYTFVCPNCGRNFSSKVALSDHERSNCGNSPIYKCNVCSKSYHSAGSLKTHSTVHSGELPHLCKYCGKAFRTQGQVKIHERKHNGIKPFKCEFCEKSFAYRESLLTHISVHTGLKRFMCQACGSRFSCISNLQAHRKSHKATCGMTPNVTKPVGPMGLEAVYKVTDVSNE